MGLRNLNIIFDNPQNIYFCGQTVSGRLIVNTDSPKKVRSIVIKFKGEAQCQWSEARRVRRNDRTHRRRVYYKGYELYFDNRIKLFGGSVGTATLPPGEHCFQFRMTLPVHLPSSFEGSHGYVRYTVKATLDRPWKFDHEVKNAFTVLSHLDLNLDPRNREPVKMENNKQFCCCCCKSGPLTLVTLIPARGFVPGQSIPLTVEVDNASNVNIYEVVSELQKIVTYHATSPHANIKKDHVDICRMKLDGSVAEGDSKTWAATMNIPALPPSELLNCSIIDIKYVLKVKAKPEGPHTDLENSFPVILGTIPLWQAPAASAGIPFPRMPPPTAPPPDMGARFLPTPSKGANSSAAALPYPDIPPPTYEECTFGTSSIGDSEDSQHVFGISGYNPRYPTYTLQTIPPPYSAPPKY